MAIQKIVAPSGASSSTVSIRPGHTLQFEFDTSSAAVDRIGNDLAIVFNDGGKTVINDFFVTEGSDLPVFVLSDGTEISSSDLLQSMNPDLDLTTAAGPIASANGSGINEYASGAGDLLAGVDRLGSLDPSFWTQETQTPDPSMGLGITTARTAGAGGGLAGGGDGGTPGGEGSTPGGEGGEAPGGGDEGNEPQPPLPPVRPDAVSYEARAVLYTSDGASEKSYGGEQIHFKLLHQGELDEIYSKHGLIDIDSLVKNPDGSYSLNLQGLAAEEALALANGDNLFDYITFTFKDGTQYTMQVVINTTGEYTPADADDSSMINNMADTQGEWHTQNKVEGSGHWEATENDDDFWLGNINGGIVVNGNASSGIHINHGAGHDTLHTQSVRANESGGNNAIAFHNGNIHVQGSVSAFDGAKNAIEANAIDIKGYLGAYRKGQNTVKANQDISILMDDTSYSVEPLAATGGSNTLESTTGSVSIEAIGTNYVRAISTFHSPGQTGRNTITAATDVHVAASSVDGQAVGIYTSDRYGVGYTTIKAGSAINITAGSTNSSSTGMYVGRGANRLEAETITVSAGYAPKDGTVTNSSATGLSAEYGGNNTLEAQSDVIVKAASLDKSAMGLKAGTSYGYTAAGFNNIISKTGSVTITAESRGGKAYAIYSSSAKNAVTANEGTISAQATSENDNAYGIYAGNWNDYTGTNTLLGKSVTVSATSDNANAYGMYAQTTSSGNNVKHTNTIQVDSEAILTAESELGEAYAMYTMAGTNKIIAAEGSTGITVTITGTGLSDADSYAMYAANSLKPTSPKNTNEIIGNSGDDLIIIDGRIVAESGGENIIFTGAGDDVVHLKGAVGENGLTLDMGDGGYDTLVLYADSYDDFMAKYGEWLDSTAFASGNVEAVHISFGTGGANAAEEYERLQEYLQDKFPDADHSYAYETPSSDVTVFNAAGLETIDFGNVLDSQQYSDVLVNLNDGKENELTITDTFFQEHDIQGDLKIMGDTADTVKLEGNWEPTGEFLLSDGGIDYRAYTNTDTDQSIFIQMEIIALTS